MANFKPIIDISDLDAIDKVLYPRYKDRILPLLNWVSQTYQTKVYVSDLSRTNLKQGYFMLGSMNPNPTYYTEKKYSIDQPNYITIYKIETLQSLLSFCDKEYKIFSKTKTQQSQIESLIKKVKEDKRKKTNTTHPSEKIILSQFFTTLADIIIGNKVLSKTSLEKIETYAKEAQKKALSTTFYKFSEWVNTREFDHLYVEGKSTFLGVDFTPQPLNDFMKKTYQMTESNYIKKVADAALKANIPYILDKKVIPEQGHIHAKISIK